MFLLLLLLKKRFLIFPALTKVTKIHLREYLKHLMFIEDKQKNCFFKRVLQNEIHFELLFTTEDLFFFSLFLLVRLCWVSFSILSFRL